MKPMPNPWIPFFLVLHLLVLPQTFASAQTQNDTLKTTEQPSGYQIQGVQTDKARAEEMHKQFPGFLEQIRGLQSSNAELLIRIAERFLQESGYCLGKAFELDEKIRQDPENAVLRKETDAQKRKLKLEEDKWRAQAIELYRRVMKEFPKFERRDEVLFTLGDLMWNQDQLPKALSVFRELLNSYPKSKFIPDVFLRFADYYFQQGQMDKALLAYKKVAEYKEAAVYPYSLYKRGWAYFNLQDYGHAKEMFKEVIRLADKQGGNRTAQIQLRKEALKDYVRVYSLEGNVDSAPRDFQKLSPQDAPAMLVRLADLYLDTGKEENAIFVYESLLAQEACSENMTLAASRIVEWASRHDDPRISTRKAGLLASMVAKVKDCQKKGGSEKANRLDEILTLTRAALQRLCNQMMEKTSKTGEKKILEEMQKFCGELLAK